MVRWWRVSRRLDGQIRSTAATPIVDWMVSAVMAEVPKSPWAAKTWRSAVTPAPFEGSKPAMVRAIGGLFAPAKGEDGGVMDSSCGGMVNECL